jgi:hypothetical protein
VVVVDCDPLTIALHLPPCAGEGPFVATLSKSSSTVVELTAVIDPETSRLTLSNIPADTARGVWLLSVTTSCGCYSAKVFVDLCRAPRFLSTHTPTPGSDPAAQSCCDPEGFVGNLTIVNQPPTEAEQVLEVDGEGLSSATLNADGDELVINLSVAATGTVQLVDLTCDQVVAEVDVVASTLAALSLSEGVFSTGYYAVAVVQ